MFTLQRKRTRRTATESVRIGSRALFCSRIRTTEITAHRRSCGKFGVLLYSNIGPRGVFRSITEGNNGVSNIKWYSAGPGWNASAGWGTPIVENAGTFLSGKLSQSRPRGGKSSSPHIQGLEV